jgi:hypothetical protein
MIWGILPGSRDEPRAADFRELAPGYFVVGDSERWAVAGSRDAGTAADDDSGSEVRSITATPLPVCPVIATRILSTPSSTSAS